METVRLTVLRRRDFACGDAFDLLSDHATGTLDAAHPLNERPLPFWDGLLPPDGHLLDGHLAAAHLDNVVPDGHLHGLHLHDDHLRPAAPLPFLTRPLYFGRFQFAARVIDRCGNAAVGLSNLAVVTVNSSPRPAGTLTKTGFDPQSQVLTFALAPSPDL